MKKINKVLCVVAALLFVLPLMSAVALGSPATPPWSDLTPILSFFYHDTFFNSSSPTVAPASAYTYTLDYTLSDDVDPVSGVPYVYSVGIDISLPISVYFDLQGLSSGSFVTLNTSHNYHLLFDPHFTVSTSTYNLNGYTVDFDNQYDEMSSYVYNGGSSTECQVYTFYYYIGTTLADNITETSTVKIHLDYFIDAQSTPANQNDFAWFVPSFKYNNINLQFWSCRYIDSEEVTDVNIFNLLTQFTSDFQAVSSDILSSLQYVGSSDFSGILSALERSLQNVEFYTTLLSNSVGYLPKRRVSGNPITIDDGAEDAAISSLIVSLPAIQAGEGSPSPNNIRPFESYSGVTLNVNGTSVPVSFSSSGSVYAGSYDVLSGKLTITHGFLVLDGSESWQLASADFPYFRLPVPISVSTSSALSSHFVRTSISGSTASIGFNLYSSTATNNMLRVRPGSDVASSLSEWKSYLASEYALGTPVSILYKLSEPVVFDLDGLELSTVLGDNIFSSSVGSMELVYSSNSTVLYFLSSIEAYLRSMVSYEAVVAQRIQSLDVNVNLIYTFLQSELVSINRNISNIYSSLIDLLSVSEVIEEYVESCNDRLLDIYNQLGTLSSYVSGIYNYLTTPSEEQQAASDAIQQDFADKGQQSGVLIGGLQLQLPQLSPGDLNIMSHLDGVQLTRVTGLLGMISGNELILTLLLIGVTGAVIGYILFGKKG